ncbi:MAG: hypothetical protein R6U41_11310 [Desulfosalsimonas sp.]|uniref:hypothetical protein n=1 Tax=Desulfosalsimonas sp. TaxID=3073848 RepID=UPI0039709DF5
MGLDEDTVRKYYKQIGGIRPTGPKGRILFFEKNVVSALRREFYAIEDNQEWADSVQGQSSEGRDDQTEAIQNKQGGQGLGSRRTQGRLVKDRHGIIS